MILKKLVFLSLLTAATSSATFAQGLVLNNESLRSDLNWLNQQDIIQISTSTWPLSSGEITRALNNAKPLTTPAQKLVMANVLQQLQLDQEQLKVKLHVATDNKNIPQSFAEAQRSQYGLALEFNASSENWATKIRANAEQEQRLADSRKFNMDGSYLAGLLANQWISISQMPTWWGPGHDGSLIRGDSNYSVIGLTAQRNVQQAFESKWLSWIGPWQYQVFAGQLQDYHAVPHAQLLGMRVTAQPLPYLELGASRVIQMGGQGQPRSLKAYWNAIIGKDNFCEDDPTSPTCGINSNQDPGNQLAGFDARLNLQTLVNAPISLYGQYIGEDEAGLLPSKKLYLAGIDFSSSYKNMPYQLYAEWADTRTNGEVMGLSYTHHTYTDGYYQQGYPLGHGIGGDGQMYTFGGNIRFDNLNRVNGRIIYTKVNQSNVAVNKLYPKEDTIKALDLTWSHYLKPDIPLKLNGWIAKSDLSGTDTGASVAVEFPLNIK